MTTVERIQRDLQAALKRRDTVVVATLRMLLAALKNAAIEERGELSEEKALTVIQREAKKRKEAITAYRQGGSAERAEQEEAELDVLAAYMPEQLDDGTIETAVQSIITSLGAAGPKDFGRVMNAAMKELRGRADGTKVQMAAKRLLEQP